MVRVLLNSYSSTLLQVKDNQMDEYLIDSFRRRKTSLHRTKTFILSILYLFLVIGIALIFNERYVLTGACLCICLGLYSEILHLKRKERELVLNLKESNHKSEFDKSGSSD